MRQGADKCSAAVKLFTSVPDLVVNVFSANNSVENSVNQLHRMGSSPSKRKVSNFSIKDALPVRFNNNNFHESNPNGTVKPAYRKEEHQRVLSKQPQQAENLPSNPQGKRLK